MVNMYKLKLTNLQQEIIRLMFIKSGMALNQRGIARMLEVSQPAVMKSLPLLKKNDLIKLEQDKESRRWSIEMNLDNKKVVQMKRVDNLKQLYESGAVDFLVENFPGCSIILFGSYSRGEDTMSSDIDIAVIGSKKKDIDLIKYHKLLERLINLNFYGSFGEIHKHLKENIFNGIVLHGSVEL